MQQITIGVDSQLEQDPLTRSHISPPANSWIAALPGTIDPLDSGEGKLDMDSHSVAFFDYKLSDGKTFKFMVTYNHNGLGGQGAPPAGYQVRTRVPDQETIIFDVETL